MRADRVSDIAWRKMGVVLFGHSRLGVAQKWRMAPSLAFETRRARWSIGAL